MDSIIDFGPLDPRTWLALYFERRARAHNRLVKARQHGSDRLDQLSIAYEQKRADIDQALRLGIASIAIDATCNSTDLSIRLDGRPAAHLPANQISDDLHARIVSEVAARAGIRI